MKLLTCGHPSLNHIQIMDEGRVQMPLYSKIVKILLSELDSIISYEAKGDQNDIDEEDEARKKKKKEKKKKKKQKEKRKKKSDKGFSFLGSLGRRRRGSKNQ